MTFDVCAWWTTRTGQTMSTKKSEFAGWLRELEETIRKQYEPSRCVAPEEAEKIALTPADAGRISEAICSILNLCDEHTAQQKAAMFAELDEARAVLWKAIDDQREPQNERKS